jgi:hypothetical protein
LTLAFFKVASAPEIACVLALGLQGKNTIDLIRKTFCTGSDFSNKGSNFRSNKNLIRPCKC